MGTDNLILRLGNTEMDEANIIRPNILHHVVHIFGCAFGMAEYVRLLIKIAPTYVEILSCAPMIWALHISEVIKDLYFDLILTDNEKIG